MHFAEFRRTRPDARIDRPPVVELSRVILTTAVVVDGRVLPEGSAGTVVGVYGHGAAFEVEFTQPFHVVATVGADAVRL